MRNKERFYVAYGSNLNIKQMAIRCPTAKLYGTGVINGYELEFKGQSSCAFATISPKEGASVPVAVWTIKPRDEQHLDVYEGYPSHYFKENVPVNLSDGKTIEAMVYIMNLNMRHGLPSPHYYDTVKTGYKNCGLDEQKLTDALMESTKKYYTEVGSEQTWHGIRQRQYRNYSFGDTESEDEDEDEEFDEEELEDDSDFVITDNDDTGDDGDIDEGDGGIDETDPFYVSDGFIW